MRIELSQDYLDKHLDIDFAVGCVLTDEQDAKVEMPVDVIEDMLEQMHEMDTKFARAELAK